MGPPSLSAAFSAHSLRRAPAKARLHRVSASREEPAGSSRQWGWSSWLALFGALLLLGACQSVPANSGPSGESGDRIPGEFLVHLEAGANPETLLERAFGSYGLEEVERLELEALAYRIRLARDPGPQALRKRAAKFPGILRVEPNFKYSIPRPPEPKGLPSDPAKAPQ